MSNGYSLDHTSVQTDRLAVYDPNDSGNVVYIRSRRMTFGESRKVRKLAMQLRIKGGNVEGDFDTGEYQLGLLLVNIVAWDGPDLQNVPITDASIDNLDGDLADAVLQAIDQVNASKKDSDPNAVRAGSDASAI